MYLGLVHEYKKVNLRNWFCNRIHSYKEKVVVMVNLY